MCKLHNSRSQKSRRWIVNKPVCVQQFSLIADSFAGNLPYEYICRRMFFIISSISSVIFLFSCTESQKLKRQSVSSLTHGCWHQLSKLTEKKNPLVTNADQGRLAPERDTQNQLGSMTPSKAKWGEISWLLAGCRWADGNSIHSLATVLTLATGLWHHQ